jgi:hypothetical protein
MQNKPEELEQLEMDYRVQLGSPAGENILNDLKMQCGYDNALFKPGDDQLALAWLEGRRSVVIYILNMMKKDES